MPKGIYVRTEEIKKILRESGKRNKGQVAWNKGIPCSEETKQKIRDTEKGENHWFYGKHHSEETKKKIGAANSIIQLGNTKWLGKHHTEETKEKLRLAHLGFKHTDEAKLKMSIASSGEKNHWFGVHRYGELCPTWKGGVTAINLIIRGSQQYTDWRISVFERDDYTCQYCGSKSGNGKKIYLNSHHIKSFKEYPELRFDIDNGITLCRDCHITKDIHKGIPKGSRIDYKGNLCNQSI